LVVARQHLDQAPRDLEHLREPGLAVKGRHLARMRLAMPATTDYWVNDTEGEPLFVVTTEANAGLVKMLPVVLDEVRPLVGDRRVTVVFDRGGWSPKPARRVHGPVVALDRGVSPEDGVLRCRGV
ncbi:MAG: hypothetical protein JW940_13580, partial [Polyangiaceae bacterium]|nr:hypothetical protein [Polyangiaceae bacterium]